MNSNFKELIISTYDSQYDLINKKISDFEKIIARNEFKEIFHEMVFCILAAGTSAKLAETASEILKEDDFFKCLINLKIGNFCIDSKTCSVSDESLINYKFNFMFKRYFSNFFCYK